MRHIHSVQLVQLLKSKYTYDLYIKNILNIVPIGYSKKLYITYLGEGLLRNVNNCVPTDIQDLYSFLVFHWNLTHGCKLQINKHNANELLSQWIFYCCILYSLAIGINNYLIVAQSQFGGITVFIKCFWCYPFQIIIA